MDPLEDAPTLLQPAAQDIEEEEDEEEEEDDTECSSHAKKLGSSADRSQVGGQEWCVVSVVAPKDMNKLAVKVSGSYASGEQADRHARNLMEKVPLFECQVQKLYSLVPHPIDDKTRKNVAHKSLNKEQEAMAEACYKNEEHFKEQVTQAHEEAEANRSKGHSVPEVDTAVPGRQWHRSEDPEADTEK